MRIRRLAAAAATVAAGALILSGCAAPQSEIVEGSSLAGGRNQPVHSYNGLTSFGNATENNNITYATLSSFNYYDNTPALVKDTSFGLARGGQLYFGGRENLWSDTIGSLGRCMGYHTAYGTVLSLFFQCAAVIAVAWAIRCLVRSLRSGSADTSGILSGLLLLGLLLPWVQHAFLDTPLPVERTALLYLPMMSLLLVRAIGSLRERTANAVAWCLGTICTLHCAVTLNVGSTYSWSFDSGGREVVDVIRKEFPGRVRLGVDYEYAPAIWHYRGIHHYDDLIVTPCASTARRWSPLPASIR